MEVPWQEIAPATLDALLEEFVTRDGTDYGEAEFSVADKVAQVRGQLRRGDVVLVFDELTESVNLLTRQQYSKAGRD